MKILFAYFGQPRFVCENIPNHIKLMQKLQKNMNDRGGVEIDILFATTSMNAVTLQKIENIIPTDITPTYDFMSEVDRAAIAVSIHSMLKTNHFDVRTVLMLYYQIISIHMLSSKIKKEYDAIYILRTDILFTIHEDNFDFSFIPYFVNRSEFNDKIYVTNMNHVISQHIPPVIVDDRILLTNNIPLRELFVDDFQENAAAYLDDSYIRWGDDAISQIHDYHSICFGFLSNSFHANKLKSNGRQYTINEHQIVPPNSITRYAYDNVENIDGGSLMKIIDATVEYDLNHNKFFHMPDELFSNKEY